jgi:3-hydroxyacyl-[acyl-carrier-protein] dehydratase
VADNQTVTEQTAWSRTTLEIAADHPAAPGHFPGNPVIPGAVLLHEVAAAISCRSTTCCAIVAAKFLHPVRPGDRLSVEWRTKGSCEFSFVCFAEPTGSKVLTGTLRMRSK